MSALMDSYPSPSPSPSNDAPCIVLPKHPESSAAQPKCAQESLSMGSPMLGGPLTISAEFQDQGQKCGTAQTCALSNMLLSNISHISHNRVYQATVPGRRRECQRQCTALGILLQQRHRHRPRSLIKWPTKATIAWNPSIIWGTRALTWALALALYIKAQHHIRSHGDHTMEI